MVLDNVKILENESWFLYDSAKYRTFKGDYTLNSKSEKLYCKKLFHDNFPFLSHLYVISSKDLIFDIKNNGFKPEKKYFF